MKSETATGKPGLASWIQTFTGRVFFPLNPNPDSVNIIDIAHSLANQCRFTGHVRHFYSIAEHSLRGSFIAPPGFELAYLLHDASETYLSDIARPVKHQPEFSSYRRYESAIERAIEKAYGFGGQAFNHPTIKEIDRRMLRTEQRDLMPFVPKEIDPRPEPPFDFIINKTMSPNVAEELFIQRFDQLKKQPIAPSLLAVEKQEQNQ